VPNPYLRRPKRWLAVLGLVVALVAVSIVGDLIWHGRGEWIAFVLVVVGIVGRIVYLRRKFRRRGIPPELSAWMDERAQKRRS
jgi:hypothetical protein